MSDQNPHSDVKLSPVDQKGIFNVFLKNKLSAFDDFCCFVSLFLLLDFGLLLKRFIFATLLIFVRKMVSLGIDGVFTAEEIRFDKLANFLE